MKVWISVLILMASIACQASATVEDTSACSTNPPAISGYPATPEYPTAPVVPARLSVAVTQQGPLDSDKYYTTPGKTTEYTVTVKNSGSYEVDAELNIDPKKCGLGWFSWTTLGLTVPAQGTKSEILLIKPDVDAAAGTYSFEITATSPNAESGTGGSQFKIQDYDYASETMISGTGQFQLNKDVRSMNSGIKSNKDIVFSGSVDAIVKNEYLVDAARGANPNFEECDAVENYLALAPGDSLLGSETVKSSIVFGGIGARVTESYNLQEMEFKQQNFDLHHTGALAKMGEFKTADNFTGYLMLDAKQVRPGQRSVKEHEEYLGSFEIQRRLLFRANPGLGKSCLGDACDFMENLNSFASSA